MNSPDSTLLVYKLEVYGSKDSALPSICDVEAVGIGAINNEFRAPKLVMSFLRRFQSYLLV
jgi:hypothetical protein